MLAGIALRYPRAWEYAWQQGNQLLSMAQEGGPTWTFTYDASGMRIGRSNGTDTYTYAYNNGLLSCMTKGDII